MAEPHQSRLREADPVLFLGFTDQLGRDLSNEAFLSSILLEDRGVVDLLTSSHTFLSERLASYYGISGTGFASHFWIPSLA